MQVTDFLYEQTQVRRHCDISSRLLKFIFVLQELKNVDIIMYTWIIIFISNLRGKTSNRWPHYRHNLDYLALSNRATTIRLKMVSYVSFISVYMVSQYPSHLAWEWKDQTVVLSILGSLKVRLAVGSGRGIGCQVVLNALRISPLSDSVGEKNKISEFKVFSQS